MYVGDRGLYEGEEMVVFAGMGTEDDPTGRYVDGCW